jgi:hypothetical protein
VLTEDNTFFVPKEASASGEGEAAGSSAQAPQEKAGQEKTGQ